MNLIDKDSIEDLLSKQNLDVRQTGDGRWIDQKCTPDVINVVADIVDTLSNDAENYNFNPKHFFAKDVWFSKPSIEYVPDIFDKPSPNEDNASREYNKFFQQPLNLLSYAGVLHRHKEGTSNVYEVNDPEILQYIGMSDRNALNFLKIYIRSVLKSSGIYGDFEDFLQQQDSESFYKLRDQFVHFCHLNTKIKGTYEPRRIFTKVLNTLAQDEHKLGASGGHLSKKTISFSTLMYNSDNFRDVFSEKPKNVSRKEWIIKHPIVKSQEAKFKLESTKAKKYVRRLNDKYFSGKSELDDKYATGKATQMHHMFPAHEYPEISGYVENIIALTPTQHMTKAHPDNNTHIIDTVYQELLLKSKANTIETVLENTDIEQIYSFSNFDHVLNVGFSDLEDDDDNESADFNTSIDKINKHYSSII